MNDSSARLTIAATAAAMRGISAGKSTFGSSTKSITRSLMFTA